MIFIALVSLILLMEFSLSAIIKFFRREFQWLITEADECPELDEKGLKKFFQHGFDPYLGWVRKPHTRGVEKGCLGQTAFTINSEGARLNPLSGKTEDIIATFGDSYTFCRQVNDNETWQVYLTDRLNMGVLNYGVGNYGVDQAVLRYERTKLPTSVKIVILELVPESICRIQSYWKHYLEFGNTFAFKPRFLLKNRKLTFIPSVMQSEEDFMDLHGKLDNIRKIDGFYRRKFKPLQFRFPYMFSFLRNPKRNTRLLSRLFIRKLMRKLGKTNPRFENMPFALIMEDNIKHAHSMYQESNARELLKAILVRFKNVALKRRHTPLIMVMPQLIDLKMCRAGRMPYHDFFHRLNRELRVIDLSDFLLKSDRKELYSEDYYGGHFSKKGNKIIGDYLFRELCSLYPEELAIPDMLVKE